MVLAMRRATTVYSGDLKWRSITVGMSADLFAWLDNMSRARDIANSTLVRELLQEAHRRHTINTLTLSVLSLCEAHHPSVAPTEPIAIAESRPELKDGTF